jgi:hypothetical protein
LCFARRATIEEDLIKARTEKAVKRQKAWARKEKQQKKAARRTERRNEKARSANKTGESYPAVPRIVD